MGFHRPSRIALIITIILVLCAGMALLVGASDRTAIDDVKYTAKMILRGHVNPAKLDTGLPVITIETRKRQAVTSKEQYIHAGIEISDPNNSGNNLQTEVEIRGRGNTTWKANKKPYRIKFPEKTSLFGHEKAKSWVLLANNQDTTLVLNTTAFELGRRMEFPFVNHCTHVELILNGRYEGSYTVTEQIQTGRGRVDIDEERGFLVELDNHYDDEPKFRTPLLGLPVMIKHPEDVPEDGAYDFVKTAVNELEAALFSDSFPHNNYRDLIDMDNFIDYIMINEITRNIDLQMFHSIYLHRDGGEDSKIRLGPLWDFDFGFDFNNGFYFNDVSGMFYNTTFRDGLGKPFFDRFFEDPFFRTKYKERWNETYSDLAGMETFIDQTAALVDASQQADRTVWWWKKGNYKEEIERLKDWWRRRIAYLNTEINKW
jgi:spore coat protein CotH